MYYIYHIPTKKIGVTRNLNKRVTIAQGYKIGEYEVLESSEDIDYISRRESELQRLYGYRVDRNSYKRLINNFKKSNQMKLNVTEQTTTFPCPVNKLKGQLLDVQGLMFETPFGSYVLDLNLINWIVSNAKVSTFRTNRCFVYNKALHEAVKANYNPIKHIDEALKGVSKVEQPNVYDLIREWADERGLYRNGDSKTQFAKLQEEAGELARAILKNDREEFIDAIGDMMVVLTNLAALEGLKVEDCVVSAYTVIKNRTGKMINGSFVKDNESKTYNSNEIRMNPYPGVTIKTTL
jgi:NTP pyrophosphatase (non-canonical NTP hydrolase)